MSEDQFVKLFKFTQDMRKEMNDRFDKTASQDSLDRLTNTLDHFAKRIEDSGIEQASRDLQFNRLLSWAKQVSKKTGIPLRDL